MDVGLYPKRMFINRGNHETKDMNRTYGFEGEAKHKHGDQTYKVITFANLIVALFTEKFSYSSSPMSSLPVRCSIR